MKHLKQIKLIAAVILFLSVHFLFSGGSECFTIIVGKDAGATEGVMVAHNEDDAGEKLIVNVHTIPPRTYNGDEVVTLKNNAVVPQVKKTFGFLWFQIPGIDFGDSYINRKGVVIASNACASREDQPGLTDGGIGFMLRRLMAERASSAREAVEIAGKLIETYGYYSSGRTYVAADSKEGWLLQVVKGKHWIAQRVPDDHAAVVANCYTITQVDLKDKKNYLGSGDIIDYAVKRGWYQPKRDGPFNFARAYSAPGNIKNEKNALRQWRGINWLSKKKYDMGAQFPFSFPVSKKSVELTDLFRVLRDHYEDTEYDLTDGYKKGSPNSTGKRTICTTTTRYSFAAELRADDIPREIASRVWIAFRRPDTNAYCPWYVSMPAPPWGYNANSPTEQHAYRYYAKLSDLVDRDYRYRIRAVRKEWRNFENYAMKRLKKMEKEFKHLAKINNHIAVKIITNFIHTLEYRKWILAADLIQRLEK
jgi:dipeptidase